MSPGYYEARLPFVFCFFKMCLCAFPLFCCDLKQHEALADASTMPLDFQLWELSAKQISFFYKLHSLKYFVIATEKELRYPATPIFLFLCYHRFSFFSFISSSRTHSHCFTDTFNLGTILFSPTIWSFYSPLRCGWGEAVGKTSQKFPRRAILVLTLIGSKVVDPVGDAHGQTWILRLQYSGRATTGAGTRSTCSTKESVIKSSWVLSLEEKEVVMDLKEVVMDLQH